jgi:cell division protein FtsQ
MDGGGRFAEPLTSPGPSRPQAGVAAERRRRNLHRDPVRVRPPGVRSSKLGSFARCLDNWSMAIAALNLPRGSGFAASALIIGASIVYGTIRGGHVAEVTARIEDARNALGSALGMPIAAVALSGQKQLSRDDILASAGVTAHTSLLFFDVAAARVRLKSNPWIAEASVQTLYPDRLQIGVTERAPFALWQQDGRVFVISTDGTVLEPFTAQRFTNLPLVVGRGAQARAKDFLALLDRYPDLRKNLRACVLVAERRWNLRLKNGIDVRLPEEDVERAIEQFAALNRNDRLISRDITVVDMRLPDRIVVQLSEAAAAARAEALKAKMPKNKGGTA